MCGASRTGRTANDGARTRAVLASTVLTAVLLAGCGASALVGTTSPSETTVSTVPASTTTTTTQLTGEVAVAFPVVACSGPPGASTPTTSPTGWQPSVLLAPIPTALVGKVAFYSDGVHTVLGPTGWTCSIVAPAPGAVGLAVYPSLDPDPPIEGPPAAGTEGIFATFGMTGRASGVALVCALFTIPSWQARSADCPAGKPAGEQTSTPTADITAVTDPAGVVGSLAGSGGQYAVTGTVIFPQVQPAVSDGSNLPVVAESCAMPDASLCPTILSDFEVREFPVPVAVGR